MIFPFFFSLLFFISGETIMSNLFSVMTTIIIDIILGFFNTLDGHFLFLCTGYCVCSTSGLSYVFMLGCLSLYNTFITSWKWNPGCIMSCFCCRNRMKLRTGSIDLGLISRTMDTKTQPISISHLFLYFRGKYRTRC